MVLILPSLDLGFKHFMLGFQYPPTHSNTDYSSDNS